jgi:hypothetical protein
MEHTIWKGGNSTLSPTPTPRLFSKERKHQGTQFLMKSSKGEHRLFFPLPYALGVKEQNTKIFTMITKAFRKSTFSVIQVFNIVLGIRAEYSINRILTFKI